jgi:putative ABC transport system permease protein
LRAGHREKENAITGIGPDTRLRRIVTASGGIHPLPPEGLLMSALLAEQLAVETGDVVEVEVLEGERRAARVPVAGVVEDFMGLAVYMNLEALHELTRGERSYTGAWLRVDEASRPVVNRGLKQVPAVASVASPAQMLASFEERLAEGLFIGISFILGFSGVIAVAVIYNGARIALSERGRELACLRVLGFTRREVAVLLLGEQAITTLVGIPFGMALGYLLAAAVSAGLQTETYRIPLLVSGRTYVVAAAVTLLAGVLSGWIVRRRLDRLDLIAVLKTRE